MKLSCSIMAHPDRAPMVAELVQSLGCGWEDVPTSWDQQGSPSGRGDRIWANARAAWLMHDPAADWHVMLQDDAVVCSDFLPGLARALEHVPERALVSPYLGTGPNVPRRWGRMAADADRLGASWVRSYLLMWGVAVAAPVAMIPEMVAWCDRKAGMPDDMRVGRWFQRQHADTWYTWPSLADHRRSPSLTGHRHVERVAVKHHSGSALDLEWSGSIVTDPLIVRRRGPRSAPAGAWRSARA